jgi:GNAT superfamily N-acetyltransferase
VTPLQDIRRADALEAVAFRDLHAAAPGAFARELGGATLLMAPEVPVSQFNRAIGLGLHRAATEADLDAICAAYRETGIRSFWVHLSPAAQPAGIAAWLRARGFTEPKRRSWAKFLRDVREPPPVETRYAVRHATRQDAVAVGEIVCSAFGMAPAVASWFAALVDRPRWQVLVALDGPRIVATGSLYLAAEGGWLGVAATLAEFREQGAQSALLSARIAAAAAAGCTVVATETGEPMADEPNPSFQNILRAGFRKVASRLNFEAP